MSIKIEQMLRRVREVERQGKRAFFIKQAQEEYAALERGEYVPQRGRQRLGMPIDKTPKQKRPTCGAKCRDGHACRATVVDGRNRCRLHGGLSTGAKTEAGKEAIRESNRRRAKGRREASSSVSVKEASR